MSTLSVVSPVHDEQETLEELARRLGEALDQLDDVDAEVILIDDGSRDASYPMMVAIAGRDPRFKAVQLSRNFGHQVALSAGIELASGDAVVVMDSDLQHPPELIGDFVRLWREGYDVVYGVMTERPEGWFKRVTARAFYGLLRRMTKIDMPAAAGDFRLVDRVAVDAFVSMRERDRYVRGMFAWLGFNQIGVDYVPPARYAGQSKYTVRRMSRLAFDAIFSFSVYPLRVVLVFGLFVSLVSFIVGVVSGVSKYAGIYVVPGWATIVVVVTFIGGIQLIVLGAIGEYIGRIYEEVKARPLYVVRRTHGFEK
ncbi:MAG TPA: glycosyltransferase family 2 protein [Gaiellaceae bacterium]|jgi:glycosyltransferase involved in cell wall biosynthesis|nr:glycosyltransferase family 2 protein [Gaiellaceae bacterium]